MEYLDIDTLVNNAVERHQVAATITFFLIFVTDCSDKLEGLCPLKVI